MPDVFMYSRGTCPFCHRAKALLRSKGVRWNEVDLDDEPAQRDEMIRKSGRSTVPQIWIGERHVGGSDDLAALDRSGKLDAWLGISS